MKATIKAVLFDLGETLLTFGKVSTGKIFSQSAKSTYKFIKNLNQPVGNFRIYCWRSLLTMRFHVLLSNLTGRDFNALSLLKKIGIKKGFHLTEQQWTQLGWLWYEPLSRRAVIEPDLVQTLEKLKASGLELGMLSNTFISKTSLEKHLQQLGILHFFTVRLYSYQFDFRKPDSRIFNIAAQTIGRPPENILFVGDRIDKDIAPALKAGMAAALKTAYTNTGKTPPPAAFRIDRISELPALVAKLNASQSLSSTPRALLTKNTIPN